MSRCRWLLVLLFLSPSTALACLNDTNVRAAETEFRSRYESIPNNDATIASDNHLPSSANPWGIAGVAFGSGLIFASCFAELHRRKNKV